MVVQLPALGERHSAGEGEEPAPALCWWQIPGGIRPSVQATLTSARAAVREGDDEPATVIRTPRRHHGFVPSPRSGTHVPTVDTDIWEERMSVQYLRPYWVNKKTLETCWTRTSSPIQTFETGPPTPPLQTKPLPTKVLPPERSWRGTIESADTPIRLLAAVAQNTSSEPKASATPELDPDVSAKLLEEEELRRQKLLEEEELRLQAEAREREMAEKAKAAADAAADAQAAAEKAKMFLGKFRSAGRRVGTVSHLQRMLDARRAEAAAAEKAAADAAAAAQKALDDKLAADRAWVEAHPQEAVEQLIVAASIPDVPEISRLATAYADVNGCGSDSGENEGWRPALKAAACGHTVAIDELANSGADLNQGDDTGFTPLHLAAINGHVEVVQTLLSMGADWRLEDVEGLTAVDAAMGDGRDGTEECAAMINEWDAANPDGPISSPLDSTQVSESEQGPEPESEPVPEQEQDPESVHEQEQKPEPEKETGASMDITGKASDTAEMSQTAADAAAAAAAAASDDDPENADDEGGTQAQAEESAGAEPSVDGRDPNAE